MKNKLLQVRVALKIGAEHKWGDGDYTHCFRRAIIALDEVLAGLEVAALIKDEAATSELSGESCSTGNTHPQGYWELD